MGNSAVASREGGGIPRVQELPMRRDDPTPDDRLSEVAAILARGLLRLKASRNLTPEPPGTKPQEKQNSAKKPLELSAQKRRHVLTG